MPPSPEARHREASISLAVDLIEPLAADFKPGDDPRALCAGIMQKLTSRGWRLTNAAPVPWQAPLRRQDPEPSPEPAGPSTAADAVALARQLRQRAIERAEAASAARVRDRRDAGPPSAGT